MVVNDFVWKIGGEAGFGIMSSGTIFAKACMRHGLSVCDFVEYPSLIRGGHNTYIVRANADEIFAPNLQVDMLVALNKETITLHERELTPGGAVIYDNEQIKEPGFMRTDLVQIPVPLLRLAKENGGEPVMMNGVSIGASLALLGAEFSYLEDIFSEIFGRKGQEVVTLNVKVAKAGYDFVKQNLPKDFGWKVERKENKKRMLISGSEAVALGAIKAGCRFLSAYPMTPINNIMAYLATHDEEIGLIYKQPEDEIAGINMALGASFAGVRAMTATSGGGLSLMVETLGLAAMTETPLVVINGMRPGPATGLPTWTGQADIRFVLHAAQDEFPRFVLAPGDFTEAFYLTHEAFNLADKYQTVAIVLTDKNLNESHRSETPFDTAKLTIDRGKLLSDAAADEMGDKYLRYRFTADGISPRKIPGQGGKPFLGASDEHEENSLFNEEAENRFKMMDKRMKKLTTAMVDIPEPVLYGPKDAKVTVVGFGSTKMAVLEALRLLNKNTPQANYLHYSYLWPLQVTMLQKLKESGQKMILFEGNYNGQFAGLLYEHSGVSIPRIVVKFDGRQFFPEEIIEQITAFMEVKSHDEAVELIPIGGIDAVSPLVPTSQSKPEAKNIHAQSNDIAEKEQKGKTT